MPSFGLSASALALLFCCTTFLETGVYYLQCTKCMLLNSYITAIDSSCHQWSYCSFCELHHMYFSQLAIIFKTNILFLCSFFLPERNSSLHYCTQKNSCTSKSIWKGKNLQSYNNYIYIYNIWCYLQVKISKLYGNLYNAVVWHTRTLYDFHKISGFSIDF